jgi:hypothetical protein
MSCPDCSGEMERGFVPDSTYGAAFLSCWHRGEPAATKGFLEKLRQGAGVRYDFEQMQVITAFRCTLCGLLKLYANTSVKNWQQLTEGE